VWVLAALAALTRDTGLLIGAALVIDRLWHRDWQQPGCFGASVVPAVAWYGYLAVQLPPDMPVSILAAPGWGLVRRLLWLRPYPDPRLELLLRVTHFLAVLGLGSASQSQCDGCGTVGPVQ
jgi:hypothetical protein